jgi:EmrB/QacA subfamily drug resistance transporter
MSNTQDFSVKKALLQLTAVIAGMFMVMLDGTVVNVAMNSLTKDLHSSLSTMSWTISGYTLAVAAVIPLAGWLMDQLGAKKVFLISVVLFTLGSLLCSFATTANQLILYRVIQGLGGGMVAPIGMAMVFRIAPPEKAGALMGALGVPMLLAPALGPLLAGYFVEYQTWHWIFLINIPVGIIAVLLGIKFLPDFDRKHVPKLDILGLILAPIAFTMLAYGVTESSKGWTETSTLTGLIVGGIALIFFIIVELRHSNPIMELKVFKSGKFTLGAIIMWLMMIAMFGMMLIVPLYLQSIKGLTPFEAGLVIFPQALASGVMMPISGKLYDKFGARPLAIIGLAIIAGTLFTLSNLSVDSSKTFFVLCQIGMGLGMGTSMMALNTHVLQSAPLALVNRVTPLTSAAQQVMMSFAAAGMVSFLTSRSEEHTEALKIPGNILVAVKSGNITPEVLPFVKQIQEATVSAFSDTFLLASGIAVLGWLLAWTLKRPKQAQATGNEDKEAKAAMMAGH